MFKSYISFLFFILTFIFISIPDIKAQISLSTVSDINFGVINFSQNHSGTLQIGTNGIVNFVGYGVDAVGLSSAGEVSFSSQEYGTIEVRCSKEARLSALAAGNDLILDNIEISINQRRPFGLGYRCNGINPISSPLLYDIINSNNNSIFVGAAVDLIGSRLNYSGEYSTFNSGDLTYIDVVFQ